MTYQSTQDATCAGYQLSPKANVASLWVEMDGEWKSAGYFEAEVNDSGH